MLGLRQKKNELWNCVPSDVNKCKITNWKKRSKTELTGRSPLRRRTSSLDCSAIEEEEEEGGGGGGGEKEVEEEEGEE